MIVIDGVVDDIRGPFLRQRRRLISTLTGLGAGSWSMQSRCEQWQVRDVLAHLIDTDLFWTRSIERGLAGDPTQLLDGFDPDRSTASFVEAVRGESIHTLLDRYVHAASELVDLVEALDEPAWRATAEAPPGHLPLPVVVHNALWDSWVHERDIILPLGIDATELDDEVLACLRYVAGLSPAFAVLNGVGRRGTAVFETTDPAARVIAEVDATVRVHDRQVCADALVVRGRAVELVEALSQRSPFPPSVSEPDNWMLSGIATVFDSTGSARSWPMTTDTHPTEGTHGH